MAAGDLLTKELDELYRSVAHGEIRGKRAGFIRRVLAYLFKGVAAGSGLVIATGQWPAAHQAFGIGILAAVFLDGLFSNHDRLIAEVEAGYAYSAIRHRVKTRFNREAAPLQKRIQQGDDSAEEALLALKMTVAKQLADAIEAIEALRAKADIKALKRLSLEEERGALGGVETAD